MKLRMPFDRILIRLDKRKEQTDGGILLPDTVDENKEREGVKGTIIAVGPGKPVTFSPGYVEDPDPKYAPPRKSATLPVGFTAGERVIYSKFNGNRVDIEGEEHRVVTPEDIIAVIES